MAKELQPDKEIITSTNTEVTEPVKDDAADVAAELQAQADAEAAAFKAQNENPKLTEEEAETVGRKHIEKALSKKEEELEQDEPYQPNIKYRVLDQEKEIPE